jgi:nicotinamidase-related amidase
MNITQLLRNLVTLALAGGAVFAVSPQVSAQGVIGDWSAIHAPPPPQLMSVTVAPRTTALLVMDFGTVLCNAGRAVRCPAAISNVKKVLDEARAHRMLVVYTGFPNHGGFHFVEAIRPERGEPIVLGHADKFDGTRLNSILKSHGIKTVIATGVLANGAVLFTAYGAASHGYKVVVPVDTMPGATAYAEQNAIWNLANDPGLGPRAGVTLTSSDRIQFYP